jgi:hypothetical protein
MDANRGMKERFERSITMFAERTTKKSNKQQVQREVK